LMHKIEGSFCRAWRETRELKVENVSAGSRVPSS
jgi:hypothetical protein